MEFTNVISPGIWCTTLRTVTTDSKKLHHEKKVMNFFVICQFFTKLWSHWLKLLMPFPLMSVTDHYHYIRSTASVKINVVSNQVNHLKQNEIWDGQCLFFISPWILAVQKSLIHLCLLTLYIIGLQPPKVLWHPENDAPSLLLALTLVWPVSRVTCVTWTRCHVTHVPDDASTFLNSNIVKLFLL